MKDKISFNFTTPANISCNFPNCQNYCLYFNFPDCFHFTSCKDCVKFQNTDKSSLKSTIQAALDKCRIAYTNEQLHQLALNLMASHGNYFASMKQVYTKEQGEGRRSGSKWGLKETHNLIHSLREFINQQAVATERSSLAIACKIRKIIKEFY